MVMAHAFSSNFRRGCDGKVARACEFKTSQTGQHGKSPLKERGKEETECLRHSLNFHLFGYKINVLVMQDCQVNHSCIGLELSIIDTGFILSQCLL